MTSKLHLQNIGKSFTRDGIEKVVLEGIDLDVAAGEFVSIVGASGCGKTTLLRIMDGLIEPSSGDVLHDGEAVTRPLPSLAYVFQQDSLLPWRTIERNVQIPGEFRSEPRKQLRERARENLRLVGLDGFFKHYPHELSGGMRQRANLARALTAEADTLLMDEPFSALDAQTREFMQAELLRIWEAFKKTVVLVTHQIDEAVFLSDRVVVLSARPGRVREVVEIKLPRPRSLEVKRSPEFSKYTLDIWQMIEDEAQVAMSLEASASRNTKRRGVSAAAIKSERIRAE
jgi:NitT/TauT family transport system ATP-binding protein